MHTNAMSQTFGASPIPRRVMVTGTSAVAGMERANWMTGWNTRSSVRSRPSSTPSATPATTPSP